MKSVIIFLIILGCYVSSFAQQADLAHQSASTEGGKSGQIVTTTAGDSMTTTAKIWWKPTVVCDTGAVTITVNSTFVKLLRAGETYTYPTELDAVALPKLYYKSLNATYTSVRMWWEGR